jgi:hypothetical protein
MSQPSIKERMAADAVEINRLHRRIHETVVRRGEGPAFRAAWIEACAEFHRRYDALAFPGGYSAALERFKAGDPSVVEPALCFLEARPYFFRSGYMATALMRRVKRAQLGPDQRQRLQVVLAAREAWRARKRGRDPRPI